MPSEKEKAAVDTIAHALAERFDAVTVRSHGSMVGVTRVHREIADDVLAALSAAAKERDAHTNTRDVDDSFREGDAKFWRSYHNGRYVALEEVREWVREGLAMHGGAMEDRWDRGYACALRALDGFLNDLQEQSTPKGERGDA